MNADKISQLRIDSQAKERPKGSFWLILLLVLLITGGALYYAVPRASDARRMKDGTPVKETDSFASSSTSATTPAASENSKPAASGTTAPAPRREAKSGDTILTVSGYIITRERIEISPRFMGIVKWIGVKKGDAVTNGQVVVLLDDAEQKANLAQVEARIATARVAISRAEIDYNRVQNLNRSQLDTQQAEDTARLQLEAARAQLKEAEAARELSKTYLDWTIIRSPIDGVVLEKLVDPAELVVPQSFGGGRGPSTALIALANPRDLQVEIDLNEADVAKVTLGQKCRVSPEAYLDRSYEGTVAEIAPEANRQKGTLQIKVQIVNPDEYVTPELSAKVDFLAGKKP